MQEAGRAVHDKKKQGRHLAKADALGWLSGGGGEGRECNFLNEFLKKTVGGMEVGEILLNLPLASLHLASRIILSTLT